MSAKIISKTTSIIKRRIVLLLLCVCFTMSMCACGASSAEPSGKYYGEEFDEGVYYEFDGESTCYLCIESQNMKVEYKYVVNEEDVGEAVDNDGVTHKTYVVHITDVNSSNSHKLVYDSTDDTIYDFDFGLFSK